ncbi:MAG: T9SS type A sorting domain-containing protein [candidate division WOR-3 bacterium]|uniref:T9SS type A sorting domain-containing protein n=1 Tax=candidate division WOR-3 bacterium TaxID=2052148 RepID=A0A7V4CGV1_UNCW3
MVKEVLALTVFTSLIFALSTDLSPQELYWEPEIDLCENMVNYNFAYSHYSNFITTTPNNWVHLIWYRLVNYYVLLKSWSQSGPWLSEETVSLGNISFSYNERPSIASDSNNNLHIIWRGRPTGFDNFWLFYRAKKNGIWSEICSLPTKSSNVQYAKIAGGKGDTAHIVFYLDWGGTWRIGYAKVYPSLPTPTVIDIDTISPMEWQDTSAYPHIAVDGTNRVHIVWQADININNSFPNIFYRMRDENGNWKTIETVSIYPRSVHNQYPRVNIDSEGNIHVTWMGYTQRFNHIAHRIKTRSGWQPVEIVPGEIQRYNPVAAIDPFNNLHVVYYSYEYNPTFPNIVYFKRTPEGIWEGPLFLTTQTTYHRWHPDIACSREGNIHVGFMDTRFNSYYHIFYKRHVFGSDISSKFQYNSLILSSYIFRRNKKIYYKLPIKTKASLKIYNSFGKLISTVVSEKDSFIIDIKNLPAGVYFIEFNFNESKEKKKLIIY